MKIGFFDRVLSWSRLAGRALRARRGGKRTARPTFSSCATSPQSAIRPVLRSFSGGGNPPSFAWPTEGRQSAIRNPQSAIRAIAFLAALGGFCVSGLLRAADAPPMTPASVLASMEHVADWQLANPSPHSRTEWTSGAGDAGFMALAGISGNPKYREAMLAAGETNQWQPGPAMYDADDQCIGQTYAELYLLCREPRMIQPLRGRFDAILAKPTEVTNLAFVNPQARARENWSWCDALFMAPPAWMRLYAATDDERYMNFAVTNWWRTADYLYDKQEHLFYRDSTCFQKTEANGKRVFWSRGNGWVMAGLARVLQYLPMNHPGRARFERMFEEMAAKILACQQPDGLWRASLLDPAAYPQKETSGSGFYTYALAWGVNQGLLDRAAFQPAIEKAWNALNGCVEADGKLTRVQPVGADPKTFPETSTDIFGVGAYLLAGSEVYRMAILQNNEFQVAMVRVANPSAFRRDCETVELNDQDPAQMILQSLELTGPAETHIAVMDGVSSRILDSQHYVSAPDPDPGQRPDSLVFQVDLAPGETRQYYLLPGWALPFTPQPPARKDHGAEMDDYRAGNSRGGGGAGIWDGKQLRVAGNYRNGRLITTGPVRSEFELTFDPWAADAAGRKAAMTERITVDANSWFSRMAATFTSEGKSPLAVGVGLAERPGREKATFDLKAGWVSCWQPDDKPKGATGVAIILQPGSITTFTNDNPNLPESAFVPLTQPSAEGPPPIRNMLAITRAEVGRPLVYYFGACGDRGGDFTNAAGWESYVKHVAACRAQPLVVTVAGK